jgi:tetratricopeptide (TPR) repeat protein
MSDEQNHPESTESPPAGETRSLLQRWGVPLWAAAVVAVVLVAALVWAALTYLPARTPPPTPTATPRPTNTPAPTDTPLAFAASRENELLIIVAGAADESQGPAQALYEGLAAQARGDILASGDTVRVERLREDATRAADGRKAAAAVYRAALVLWYEDSGTTLVLQMFPGQDSGTAAGRDQPAHNLSTPAQIAFCPAGATAAGTDEQVTAHAALILGAIAIRAGDADRALEQLAQALEAMPGADDCPADRAAAYLFTGNAHMLQSSAAEAADAATTAATATAVAAYTHALELDGAAQLPFAWAIYANRGVAYQAQEEYEAALADLDRALELNPEAPWAYIHRANTYRAIGDYESALADLQRALDLASDSSDGWLSRAYASRGLIYHNMGQYDQALADYSRAIELDPDSPEVYLNRGGTYANMAQFQAALADYDRVVELSPGDADAYYNRGTVYAIIEQYEPALRDLDRALELKPEFAQVYGNRGLVYKALGRREEAIADLERFLEMSDNPQWNQTIAEQLRELREQATE